MEPQTAPTTLPAISILIDGDPFFARIQELHESIARRAYEIFKESGFRLGHDLEDWHRAESDLLQQVSLKPTETDDAISLRAEVPGFTEKDLEVKVDPHRVYITGKHVTSTENKEDKTVRSEQSSREIFQEYCLPAEIDPEEVSAEFKDGVLEIRLPKCVESTKVKVTSRAA